MNEIVQDISNVNNYIQASNEYILSANSTIGIAGYGLYALKNCSLDAQSEITDYQLETGDYIQNYIANKPFTISLTGTVSEMYFEAESQDLLAPVAKTARQLFNISNSVALLSDGLTTALEDLTDGETGLEEVGDNAIDLYSSIKDNLIDNSEVKKAVRFFLALRGAKQTVSLTTPFGIFHNMGITGVGFSTNNTKVHSADFEISLKRIKIKNKTSGQDKQAISQAKKDVVSEVKEVKEGAAEKFDSITELLNLGG